MSSAIGNEPQVSDRYYHEKAGKLTPSYPAVSVTGLPDTTASFTADYLNTAVYDFILFSDM